jgi:hypothetical protein
VRHTKSINAKMVVVLMGINLLSEGKIC